MTKNKIFISHSSHDSKFVESFVENILLLGLDIPSERIFCSSMEGHGVKSGQYIPDRLHDEIQITSIALLFISKNYKSSEICLNEVGAAWATLQKENVIPLLLPSVDFKELGFLDLGRLGLKIYEKSGILKLIQDCKEQLNPSFNLEKLHKKMECFILAINELDTVEGIHEESKEIAEHNEWDECFNKNLFALDEIIRQSIPAHNEGIHQIKDVALQNKILTNLSNAKFLNSFWYKQANGDFYVKKLVQITSGNWLISSFNWEVKIDDMWISMNSEHQYEFILIHSAAQPPYKIDSDIGGENYYVGVLKNGTIVSENERQNGYGIIGGKTIELYEHGVEPRHRDEEPHWIFLVSYYHKAGYNADETIEFCKKLDSGEIEVNEENIMDFLSSLANNPTVIMYR